MNPKLICSILLTFACIQKAQSIDCYQCVSTDVTDPYQCGEFVDEDNIDIKPKPCSSVYNAAYCIKHTGRSEAQLIVCYQCNAPENIDCGDPMIHMDDGGTAEIASCDYIYNAQYCIKTVGLYGGGLATRRFCSALDMGNYCNYIRQPGDVLEYRSCVYTCDSDGCNSSHDLKPAVSGLFLSFLALLFSLR